MLDDGVFTYGWSGDGGLTSRVAKASGAEQRFSHQWMGLRNQAMLRSISDVADFYYDAFGRLTATVWASGGGNVDSYTDGPDVALELRNVFGGENRRWVRYVHGADDDQILAMELYPLGADPVPGTGQQYYFHPDAEGSVRLVTDAAAQVANRYDYDSYGRRVSVVESVAQPYGWKGREFIPGAELYYNRARFYDPVMGRFISEDPLGYEGGSNFYSFAGNDPRNGRDPSGLAEGISAGQMARQALMLAPGAAALGCAVSVQLSSLAARIGTPDDSYMVGIKPGDVPCTVKGVYAQKTATDTSEPQRCVDITGGVWAVGELGYRYDPNSRPHYPFPDRNHTHWSKVNMNPNNGQCFWREVDVTGGPPSPGMREMKPFK